MSESQPGNFADDNHALAAGCVLGVLMRSGAVTNVEPIIDINGNYTDRITLTVEPYRRPIIIQVLPSDLTSG